ncbi:YdcF family protein [Alicyclobacillus fastidiosus]|uniref:YdcF family protein n=1 Tax=Alicyclobacillus fastidiosus TaxID=392011 RepID=A0ABV5A968_9BACL|nr:YdcF family protein [Alicyclobacillus fastidiosus]WEH10762.1 YdcF family protein [Alicyclobacillus fastidiosus]
MFSLLKIIESFMLPPGLFVVLLVGVGAFVYRRTRAAGACLCALAVVLYVTATQAFANALVRPLEDAYPQPQHPHGDVIVMLGGGSVLGTPDIDGKGGLTGNSANRLIAVARLYPIEHLPILITAGPDNIVNGQSESEAQIAKRELVGLGIPAKAIYTENNSRNTQENAQFTKPILKAHHFVHPILVTSAFHMSRAVLDFERAGMEVTPFPTDYQASEESGRGQYLWLPSATALNVTTLSVKEYVGWVATKIGVKG